MRFCLASDLHLEFPNHKPIEFPQADVLVLAGDILVAEDLRRTPAVLGPRSLSALRYREFLDQVTHRYQHVVWVAGNHEFYHGKFTQTLQVLRNEAQHYQNLYFLEDSWVDVEDVRFLGGTLWTDVNRGCPVTTSALQYGMNDYKLITDDTHGYTRLKPSRTAQRHHKTKNYIQQNITTNTVVVTHHAPTPLSIAEEFKTEQYLNGGYASDLSTLILDHQPRFWLHGHMHQYVDYTVGETRVICNPRGYPGQNPDWTPQVYEL